MQLCLLTSHHNGCGLLGRVSHIVAGHAAVDPCLIWGDGWQCERAPLHHAPLWQAVITADPGECGGRLPTCGDAHQRYRLARIHHDWILHQQFDGWRCCGGSSVRKTGRRWTASAVTTITTLLRRCTSLNLSVFMSVLHLLRHLCRFLYCKIVIKLSKAAILDILYLCRKVKVLEPVLPVLLVSLKMTLRSGIPHTFLTEAMQL